MGFKVLEGGQFGKDVIGEAPILGTSLIILYGLVTLNWGVVHGMIYSYLCNWFSSDGGK